MVIASKSNRSGPYAGNGATTIFAWGTFQVNDPDHLKVYKTANGITTELTSGFTKSGIPGTFGNVTFATAPESGTQITLVREVPNLQESDYTNQGRVQPETVEDDLDLLTMQVQDVSARVDRAIVLDVSAEGLPEITPSASKVFGFDSEGAFTQFPLTEIGGTAFIELGDNVQEIADILEVSALGPDDFVLGAGTAWRKVRAKNLTGYAYTIEMFGAIGNGVADDTDAFRAFQQIALASPNTVDAVLILAPGKHYTYDYNKWGMGFRSLKIIGNGARLECTSTAAFTVDSNCLMFQNWNSDDGLLDRGATPTLFNGYLINSVAADSDTVVTSTASEAANMSPGDWVLVYGLANQTSGAPMNARYFEYRQVSSVNGVTGEVVLTEPLAHAYNANWPKLYNAFGEDYGPARILPLKRANRYLTERLEIQDVVWIANRNSPSDSRFDVVGVLQMLCRNCDFTDLVETTNGSMDLAIFEHCRFGEFEGDKLCTRLELWHCDIGLGDPGDPEDEGISQGVGTVFIYLRSCRVHNRIELGGRNVLLEQVTFENVDDGGAAYVMQPNYTNPYRTESFVVSDSVVVGDRRRLFDSPENLYQTTTFSSFNVSNNLIYPKASWNSIDHILPGMRLVSDDRTEVCTVVDIIEHDATNVLIQVVWETAPPAGAVTLYSARSGVLETRGRSRTPITRHGGCVYLDVRSDDPEFLFEPAASTPISLGGPMQLSRVEVDVIRASTIAGAALWLRNLTTDSNAVTVDLTAEGSRVYHANSTAIGNDTVTAAAFVSGRFRLNPRGSGNEIVGTPSQLPIFAIRAVFSTLLN